jgi:hypothetical protein
VNSSGRDWDILILFYMMADSGTPYGTSQFSPFFLLHGREMVLRTSQDLRVKLTSEVRETYYAHRLENLKSTLKSAYKIVRENSRKSHDTNKGYYERKAKERSFQPGEIVYVFKPTRKPGECSKFFFVWQGSYKVTASVSKPNCSVVNQHERNWWYS